MENYISKWISFELDGDSDSGKTSIWSVYSNSTKAGEADEVFLGTIKWFGRWRKYAFFPEPELVFEEECMRDIATVIEQATREHRAR